MNNYVKTYGAVDKNGNEFLYNHLPARGIDYWKCAGERDGYEHFIQVPKGTISFMLGSEVNWSNEPVILFDSESK